MGAARVLFGRMGLAVGLLIGLGVGALWWAGQPDAVPAPDAAYTVVTPCVAFDSRASQGATGAFFGPLNGGQAVTYKAGTFGAAQGGGNTDCGVPVGATSVEINIVAVNALNEGICGSPTVPLPAPVGLSTTTPCRPSSTPPTR